MYGTHVVWLVGYDGKRIRELGDYETIQYTRVANTRGFLVLTYDWNLRPDVQKDYLIEVWRTAPGGAERWQGSYFVRRVTREVTERGRKKMSFAGPGLNDLLRRREVSYASSTPQADKGGYAGDVMKGLVRDNLGATAGFVRDLTPAGLTVAGDTHDGAWVVLAAARAKVLDMCQQAADGSYNAGSPVYFQMRAASFDPLALVFETMPGQPGVDRSGTVVLDPALGNVRELTYEVDWTEEITVANVGGQGKGPNRAMATVTNGLQTETPWAYIEDFADGGATSDVGILTGRGHSRLAAMRARVTLAATLVDTESFVYGRDLEVGDRCTVRAFGEELTVLLRSDQWTVSGVGVESIDVNLEVIG